MYVSSPEKTEKEEEKSKEKKKLRRRVWRKEGIEYVFLIDV